MDYIRFPNVLMPPKPKPASEKPVSEKPASEELADEDLAQAPHQIRDVSTPGRPILRCIPGLHLDVPEIKNIHSGTGDKTPFGEKSSSRSSRVEAPAIPPTTAASSSDRSNALKVRVPRVRPGPFEAARRKCLGDMIACPYPGMTADFASPQKGVGLKTSRWTKSEKERIYYSAPPFAPEYLNLHVGLAIVDDQESLEVCVTCS